MYTELLNAILFADFIIKLLIGIGVITGISAVGCMIWWGVSFYSPDFKKRAIFFTIALSTLCIGCVAVGNSKYFQQEYIVMKVAAPALDKYIEDHPDAIYNPDTALTMINDTALSLVSSIKNLPDLVKRIASGETIEKIRAEQEIEEFKAWKESRK